MEVGKDMNSDGFESMLRRNFAIKSPVGEELVEVFRASGTGLIAH